MEYSIGRSKRYVEECGCYVMYRGNGRRAFIPCLEHRTEARANLVWRGTPSYVEFFAYFFPILGFGGCITIILYIILFLTGIIK
jgi:hypothetical protein